MKMNDCIYLVDNNVLSKLSREQRSSQFFRDQCRIPSEVLHEARDYPDINALKQLEYPTTPDVLLRLQQIMTTIPTTDTRLVDLYANKGNADPLILACALDAQRRDEVYLWAPTWVVVSDDRAVQDKALELKVELRTGAQFIATLTR
ncbi:hypothetical protein GII32_10740 [Gordonia amarae]|uniref:hypothetical protein n=1 Tax=Gordonia amarae TaxID=36821 RepID=UPI001AF4E2A7|nr:hypothetical protein [Gordonia amarae]QHN30794.1 hypothetical protein GII32_10740 [Gordonia amarae]